MDQIEIENILMGEDLSGVDLTLFLFRNNVTRPCTDISLSREIQKEYKISATLARDALHTAQIQRSK